MAINNIYVTVAGAGNKGGSTWANAMGLAEWETDLEAPASADDVYWVEEGTYTLTEDIDDTLVDGTATAPIRIIGVVSGTSNEPPVFSDHAFGTDRPLIAAAANMWRFGDYWIFKNLRHTTTEAQGWTCQNGCVFYNCSSNNSSGTADRVAFYPDINYNKLIACDGQSASGYAFNMAGQSNAAFACYAHDSKYGIRATAGIMHIINCVVDTCTTSGIDCVSRDYHLIIGNTVYNCALGITGTDSFAILVANNIMDACTTGASWTTAQAINYWNHNCWDNTTDTSNVTKGDNAVTGDPSMTDPANGDFSIPSGSNCVDAALDAGDHTGATV
jgi:hypothetical protein